MKYLKILIVLIVLGLVMFFLLGMKSQKGSAPGLVDGSLSDCPSSPNCASSEQGTESKKQVEPLQGTMAQAVAAIENLGGKIVENTNGYVSATFTSSIFKFVDDVELRLGESGEIHIRSASRVGYSDRGENKKRIAAIRAQMASK